MDRAPGKCPHFPGLRHDPCIVQRAVPVIEAAAGLAACGLPAPEAAACAVWLHGAAADRTALRLGQYGMLPHDILTDLGAIFAENYR